MSSLGSIARSFIVPSRIIFFMWLVFFLQVNLGYNFFVEGIYPRTLIGLLAIPFAPLLHGNLPHLVSNTLPLLFLGVTLYYFYGRLGHQVFVLSYFLTGVLVWLLARPFYHLGASGLIYGIASFLFFSGIFRTEFRAMLISLTVVLAYGGLVWGILPTLPGISWESHLFGAAVGGIIAYHYRQHKIR